MTWRLYGSILYGSACDIEIVWILKSGVHFSIKKKQKEIVLLPYKINHEAFLLFPPSKVV